MASIYTETDGWIEENPEKVEKRIKSLNENTKRLNEITKEISKKLERDKKIKDYHEKEINEYEKFYYSWKEGYDSVWGDEPISGADGYQKALKTWGEMNREEEIPKSGREDISYSVYDNQTSASKNQGWDNYKNYETYRKLWIQEDNTEQIIKNLKSDLNQKKKDFDVLSLKNGQLIVDNHNLIKNNEKLLMEIKLLREKLELLEKNPEEYKKRKELDPYGEEDWEK